MTTPWSCKFVYSSDEEEGNNEESCIPSDDSKNDALSVSRPLLYTITMSSGSSGADTFSSMSESDALSSSEPSTRAGTPPETPAADTGGRTLLALPANLSQIVSADRLRIHSAQFISPTPSGQDVGYEAETDFSFSRLVLSSGVPNDSVDQNMVAPTPLWARRTDAAGGRTLGREEAGLRSHSRKRGSPRPRPQSQGQETVPGVSLPLRPSLQRSRRPPPLDLSVVSCDRVLTREKDEKVYPCNEDPSPNTPVRRPHTAPLALEVDTTMKPELSPPPATAPLLITPKAPVIRPSVLACQQTPSPLTLPSPCLSWALDSGSQPTTASTLWSPTSPQPSPALSHDSKGALWPRNRPSLVQKIAGLRRSSASGPIPPSLKNSPILNYITSPRFPQELTYETSVLSPPTHFVGTPLRVHMNPYFSRRSVSGGLDKELSVSFLAEPGESSGIGISSYFAQPSVCENIAYLD